MIVCLLAIVCTGFDRTVLRRSVLVKAGGVYAVHFVMLPSVSNYPEAWERMVTWESGEEEADLLVSVQTKSHLRQWK